MNSGQVKGASLNQLRNGLAVVGLNKPKAAGERVAGVIAYSPSQTDHVAMFAQVGVVIFLVPLVAQTWVDCCVLKGNCPTSHADGSVPGAKFRGVLYALEWESKTKSLSDDVPESRLSRLEIRRAVSSAHAQLPWRSQAPLAMPPIS